MYSGTCYAQTGSASKIKGERLFNSASVCSETRKAYLGQSEVYQDIHKLCTK